MGWSLLDAKQEREISRIKVYSSPTSIAFVVIKLNVLSPFHVQKIVKIVNETEIRKDSLLIVPILSMFIIRKQSKTYVRAILYFIQYQFCGSCPIK